MIVNGIHYKDIVDDFYKYETTDDYTYKTKIKGFEIDEKYFSLDRDGLLTIMRGYRWDGPSGPAVDTDNWMRGSLVHDTLYQMIRDGLLPSKVRAKADKTMYKIIRDDGMSWIRANYSYYAVRIVGRFYVI